MIPKRIIVTFKSRPTMNAVMQSCLKRMQDLHPAWEVLFFADGDCEDFVSKLGNGYLDLYKWYPRPVQKSDLFRMLAIWELGGFYLDADVMLSRPLDLLSSLNCVFPWEWEMDPPTFEKRFPMAIRGKVKPWMVGQYAFGACAKDPFLSDILQQMVERTASFEVDRCTNNDVLHSTGPDVVTTCYYKAPSKWRHVTLLHGEIDPLAEVVTESNNPSWHRFGQYGRHLLNGSWK